MNVTIVPKTIPDLFIGNTNQTSKKSINTSFFNSPKTTMTKKKSSDFLKREALIKQKMLNLEKNFSPTNAYVPT